MSKKRIAIFLKMVLAANVAIVCEASDNSIVSAESMAEELDLSEFETVDLQGNAVTQDVFKDYDITMVNLWTTWCGPCRNELPEIQEVYGKLPENANIISICYDAAEDLELANRIVEKTGIQYSVLIPDEKLMESVFKYISAVPTTILVDSEGHLAGKPIIGVPMEEDVAQAYLDYIDSELEKDE